MTGAIRGIGYAFLVFVTAALTGCTAKVWVMTPPDVDLGSYERIGLVQFEGDDAKVRQLATQQFQQSVQGAQTSVRIVELGDAQQVLASIGHAQLDASAIQAIGAKHDLDAVFVGGMDLTGVSPSINVMMSLIRVRGSLDMRGTMSARLIETGGGATVWTCSRRGSVTIAHADVTSEGTGEVGAADPTLMIHGPLVEDLAWGVTDDFRAAYFRKRPEDVPPHYVPTYPDGVEVFAPPLASRASAD